MVSFSHDMLIAEQALPLLLVEHTLLSLLTVSSPAGSESSAASVWSANTLSTALLLLYQPTVSYPHDTLWAEHAPPVVWEEQPLLSLLTGSSAAGSELSAASV
jgi:hypothetical protein